MEDKFTILNKWLKLVSQGNIDLHSAVLSAMEEYRQYHPFVETTQNPKRIFGSVSCPEKCMERNRPKNRCCIYPVGSCAECQV